MPSKYLTLFFFMFILKLQLIKAKCFQYAFWYSLGKFVVQMSRVWNVRKGKEIKQVLLETLSELQWLQSGHRPDSPSLPTTRTSCR
jgi:hypothetical protein